VSITKTSCKAKQSKAKKDEKQKQFFKCIAEKNEKCIFFSGDCYDCNFLVSFSHFRFFHFICISRANFLALGSSHFSLYDLCNPSHPLFFCFC
jgi:hypothetical protein